MFSNEEQRNTKNCTAKGIEMTSLTSHAQWVAAAEAPSNHRHDLDERTTHYKPSMLAAAATTATRVSRSRPGQRPVTSERPACAND